MTGRVLIYRPGSLGDTVVALPCLKLIRRTFPDAELRLLANLRTSPNAAPPADVLEGMGLIDGYLEHPVPLRSLADAWRLAGAIRRWRPDRLIYLVRRETSLQVRRDAAFFRACGIREIAGLPSSRDLRENRPRADGLFEPEAERLARTLEALGAARVCDPANRDLELTDADRALPRRLMSEQIGGQSFIVVGMGTKHALNDWGIDNWRTLAEPLRRDYPHKLVFIGADGDRASSDRVVRELGDRAVNLCGRLKVRESAALIEEASLFLGHDSGPMHLAAAVGTPMVAIFSRFWPPGIWYPSGYRGVMLYPTGATIGSITPAVVFDSVRTQLPAGADRKLSARP